MRIFIGNECMTIRIVIVFTFVGTTLTNKRSKLTFDCLHKSKS